MAAGLRLRGERAGPPPRFEGDLDRFELLARVRVASGLGGSNLDYLRETVAHLRELGIAEPKLEALLAEAQGATAPPRETG